MGYKPYGDEPTRSHLGEFFEWFFSAFMAFSMCIGGWLVHFGMSVWLMLALTAVISLVMAIKLTKK